MRVLCPSARNLAWCAKIFLKIIPLPENLGKETAIVTCLSIVSREDTCFRAQPVFKTNVWSATIAQPNRLGLERSQLAPDNALATTDAFPQCFDLVGCEFSKFTRCLYVQFEFTERLPMKMLEI